MYANGSATPALTLNSTTLTANQLSITGTTGMQSTYAAQCVYMGSMGATSAGIKLNGPNGSYINFTKPNCVWHGSIDYSNTTSKFQFAVNNSTTNILTISTTGISVVGTSASSSDKRLKFNENH